MKIAITGHSAGIGLALSEVYTSKGHEVVGISRRIGLNILNIPRVLGIIEECDVFINNAQSGFGQTTLLEAVWNKWRGLKNKKIINISTMMTTQTFSTNNPGMEMYKTQKKALESLHWNLRAIDQSPEMILVKPGAVATQPGNTVGEYADVREWATALINCLEIVGPNLSIAEITLRPV